MLTPEYLRDAPEEIVKLFIEMEERILCDIAERIALNRYNMTSTAQYQFDKLKELGLLQQEVQKELAELLNISEDKVSKIIQESSYKSVDSDNEIYKKAYEKGKILNFNPNYDNLTSAILSGISATNGEIRNICMSTANAANKAFTDVLDNAYLSVSSGAFSYADAVRVAVNNLGKNGLNWIDYESGAHRRVDSAIRNALRTGINQTASKCQELNFDEMDGTYVEVSSHMGARTGMGIANHAAWQGKIYFWSKPGKVNEHNYPDFVTSTGYGSGAGLGGWGCRHNWFPYFPGISEPTFEHYDEKENAKLYEAEQEQRRNERAIREWKRRMNVNKAGGVDSTKEQRKVKEWEARQKALLKKHPDLKRNFAREQIEKRKITSKEIMVRRNSNLYKGYESAVKKGDISSFVTFDTYKTIADRIEKELVGIKRKDGIIVSGYKTHFIDRIIGQYEDSNEPIKGMRKGVSIEDAKDALLNGVVKEMPLRGNGKRSRRYITDKCFVTVNPNTKELIQATPKR